MITGHVFIATSLDGFIAREDGTIEWLLERDDPAEDHGYRDFIKDIDFIVMGRCSFETMRDHRPWPYDRSVLVLSKTLSDYVIPSDLAGKVRIFAGSPQQAMAMLEAKGCRRVYVDGGLVIQSFLRQGLISDIVVTTVPVLLGGGRRLFGPLSQDVPLSHVTTRTFPSGLVQSTYRVIR